MIPISDWLHLCKNLRSRFISQKIILFKGSQIIDPEIICQKLQLNPKVLYAYNTNFEEYSCLVFLPFVLFTDVLQPEILPIEFKKTVMLYII